MAAGPRDQNTDQGETMKLVTNGFFLLWVGATVYLAATMGLLW